MGVTSAQETTRGGISAGSEVSQVYSNTQASYRLKSTLDALLYVGDLRKATAKDNKSTCGGRVKSTPPRRAAPAKADIVHWHQVAPGYQWNLFVPKRAFVKHSVGKPCMSKSIRENGISNQYRRERFQASHSACEYWAAAGAIVTSHSPCV